MTTIRKCTVYGKQSINILHDLTFSCSCNDRMTSIATTLVTQIDGPPPLLLKHVEQVHPPSTRTPNYI